MISHFCSLAVAEIDKTSSICSSTEESHLCTLSRAIRSASADISHAVTAELYRSKASVTAIQPLPVPTSSTCRGTGGCKAQYE